MRRIKLDLRKLKIKDGNSPAQRQEVELLEYQLRTGKVTIATLINMVNSMPGFDIVITGITVEREGNV